MNWKILGQAALVALAIFISLTIIVVAIWVIGPYFSVFILFVLLVAWIYLVHECEEKEE